MTYARKKTNEAIAAFTKGNRTVTCNGEQLADLEAVIASVIEDCAAQCEDASTVGDFYAKRIRALAAGTPKGTTCGTCGGAERFEYRGMDGNDVSNPCPTCRGSTPRERR